MKTTNIHKSLLFIIVLLSAACKKEMNETNFQAIDTNNTGAATSTQDECRLVNSSSEFGQTTFCISFQVS